MYIELLDDMVSLPCERPVGDLLPARKLSDPSGLNAAMKLLTEKLSQASRPVLWVGAVHSWAQGAPSAWFEYCGL